MFFRENKTWSFKWILCLAEDSYEKSSLIFFKRQKSKKFKCNLLQFLFGALRVNFDSKKKSETKHWLTLPFSLLWFAFLYIWFIFYLNNHVILISFLLASTRKEKQNRFRWSHLSWLLPPLYTGGLFLCYMFDESIVI